MKIKSRMDAESTKFILTRIIGSEPIKSGDGVILFNQHKGYSCGRTEKNDIVCNSDSVSLRHCNFLCKTEDIYIQDLNSENGTYVNGKKLNRYELVKIKNNDIIGIGTSKQSSDETDDFIFLLEKEIIIDLEKLVSETQTSSLECEKICLPDTKGLKFIVVGNQSIAVEQHSANDEELSFLFKWDEDIQSPIKFKVECSIFEQNNNEGLSIDMTQNSFNSISVKMKSIESEEHVRFLGQIDRSEASRTLSNIENVSANNNENMFINEEESIPTQEKSIVRTDVRENTSMKDCFEKTLSGNQEVLFSLGPYLKSSQNPTILNQAEIPDTNSGSPIQNKIRQSNYFFISDDETVSLEDEESDSNKDEVDKILNPFTKIFPATDENQKSVVRKIENNIRLVDYDLNEESSSDFEIYYEKNEFDLRNELNIDEGFQTNVLNESQTVENNCLNVENNKITGIDKESKEYKFDLDNFLNENNVSNPLSRFKTSEDQDRVTKILESCESETRVLTQNYLKKGKIMNKTQVKLKDLRVVLEKIDIKSKSCVSEISKNQGNRESNLENVQTSEDQCLLSDRLNVQSWNRNSSINEENNQSINEENEISVDERPFIIDDESDKMISQIVKLNPITFQAEKEKGKRIPSIMQKDNVEKVSKSYESYEEYRKMLTSHLLFDITQKIKKAIATIDIDSRSQKCEVVTNSATKIMIRGTNSYLLGFEIIITVLNPNTFKVPSIGNLLRLQIFNESLKSPQLIFAYVRNVTKISIENNRIEISCALVTNWLKYNIYASKILDLRIIMSLLDTFNSVQVMSEFESSPLLPFILKPELETYKLPDFAKSTILLPRSSSAQFNTHLDYMQSKQFRSLMQITKSIVNEEPKVCLIEGPPGTGKTKTITDIIFAVINSNVIRNNLPPKIMVCAKSKTVVDELLRLTFIKTKSGRDVKMIRIGYPGIINPEIKEFSLPILAEQNVSLWIDEFLLSQKIEHYPETNYEEEIMSLLNRYNELKYPNNAIKTHVLKSCLKIQETGKSVQGMDEEDFAKLVEFAENTLLLEANVIFSTLSKCHTILRRKEEISVCIIDDAAQIPEIEILKPLTFGVKILVLSGDPYKNLYLGNNNYDLNTWRLNDSLFSRIKLNFDGLESSPIIKFNLQYRFSEKVMSCLNKIIFCGDLKNHSSYDTFPLFPCKIFHLYSNGSQSDEAFFVGNLIHSIIEFSNLTNITKPLRIGVIIPFAAAKSGIISAINASLRKTVVKRRERFEIDVDTISGFKNQERDVVIVACTKRIVGDEWLYSSISRAKYSLILYGSFAKLKKPCLLKAMIENTKDQRIPMHYLPYNTGYLKLKKYIVI